MHRASQEVAGLPFSPDIMRKGVVFDLETKGRYVRTNRITAARLIGSRCPAEDQTGPYVEYIWYTEKPEDEYDLLLEVSRILADYSRIITFNGTSFDLPQFTGKCSLYGLADPMPGKAFLDLYRELRSLSSFFSLPDHKLDTYASLLSAESIPEDDAQKAFAVTALLLLNPLREDLTLWSPPEIRENVLLFRTRSALTLPFSFRKSLGSLSLFTEKAAAEPGTLCVLREGQADNAVLFASGICEGRIRHYYPDTENYVWLPLEGSAVHRSLGDFLPSSRKEPAQPETCFRSVPLSASLLTDPARYRKYLSDCLFSLFQG